MKAQMIWQLLRRKNFWIAKIAESVLTDLLSILSVVNSATLLEETSHIR